MKAKASTLASTTCTAVAFKALLITLCQDLVSCESPLQVDAGDSRLTPSQSIGSALLQTEVFLKEQPSESIGKDDYSFFWNREWEQASTSAYSFLEVFTNDLILFVTEVALGAVAAKLFMAFNMETGAPRVMKRRRFHRGTIQHDGPGAHVESTAIARSGFASPSASTDLGSAQDSIQTPTIDLADAVRMGDDAKALRIISEGSAGHSLSAVDPLDSWGCTALHIVANASGRSHASGSAAVTVAKLLLMKGAFVDAVDAWDETPLHLAARAGSDQLCDFLLAVGANADSGNAGGSTPLVEAAAAGHTASCEVLLTHGAGVGQVTEDNLPPLLTMLLAQRCILAQGS